MDYLSRNFNYDYITKKVKLTWDDIVYGIENGYVSPDIAIEHAISEVARCEEYPESLIDLASLRKGESVYPHLNELANLERIQQDNECIKQKWMYLVLDWVYYNKDKYSDSLGLVEQIYSDFDYSEQISTFVRYMPTNEPDLGSLELNKARLFKNWKRYLEEQNKRFAQTEDEV